MTSQRYFATECFHISQVTQTPINPTINLLVPSPQQWTSWQTVWPRQRFICTTFYMNILNMEAAGSSETLVTSYQTRRCQNTRKGKSYSLPHTCHEFMSLPLYPRRKEPRCPSNRGEDGMICRIEILLAPAGIRTPDGVWRRWQRKCFYCTRKLMLCRPVTFLAVLHTRTFTHILKS